MLERLSLNPLNWFRSTNERIVERPMREAAGSTIDADTEEAGWRRLTGDDSRDLSPISQDRMQRLAYWMWEQNNLGNRLIELPIAYLLAEGVRLTVDDDEAQAALDRFWKDPINAMDLKLMKKARELGLYGEQCWPAFVNEADGHVRLGYLDPCNIAVVVTDPDNIEQAIGIVTKKDKKGNARRYKVIVNGEDDEVFTQRTAEIRESFDDGECFYFKVNDLSNSRRGRSDLISQIDWLDGYDQFLFGEMERSDFLRAFIWDVTLKGATPDEVKERAKDIHTPNPGSVRVHNEAEEWEATSPELGAGDTDTIARLLRNHVLGGATVPEHWFGGGGDVNRATGESMSEPTFKMLAARQRVLKYILEYVGTYVLRQWADKKRREADIEGLDVQAVFPEITARDTTKYAAALGSVAMAAGVLLDRGLITESYAMSLVQSIAGQLGVEVDDPEQLLEDARKEAAKRQADEFEVPEVAGDED